jgi:hypothetical protein
MQELDLPLIIFILLLTHDQVLGGLAELILQVADVPFHLVDRFLELGALDVMLLLQHVKLEYAFMLRLHQLLLVRHRMLQFQLKGQDLMVLFTQLPLGVQELFSELS